MKNVDVIRTFINGGRKAKTTNLEIVNSNLFNYNTVIAEYTNEYGLILNVTKYSQSTSTIQNALIRELKDAGIAYVTVSGLGRGASRLAGHYEKQNPNVA
jgi:flagellar basal body rod protein FlgC